MNFEKIQSNKPRMNYFEYKAYKVRKVKKQKKGSK